MYEAKIILDSVGPNGARLTTLELSYPRMVHAELMTHRMFSRNSASSRAIPVERLLARVESDPVLPVWWGKNQSGMQAREELSDAPDREHEITGSVSSPRGRAVDAWLDGRDEALRRARRLGGELNLHKQIANRIVEPWMFITCVVTATEFENFWALRDSKDAQPELADVAGKAHRLYEDREPTALKSGEWHLPYVTGLDAHLLVADQDAMCRISVGRCAAVSYLNQDKIDPNADLARADRLAAAGHMSPFEHVAQAMDGTEWEVYAADAALAWTLDRVPMGNLWGWRQYRKTLPNEHDFSKIERSQP